MTGTDMPPQKWGAIDRSALTSRMPIREYDPMPVAELPGVSIRDFLDAYEVDPLDETLTPIQTMLRNMQEKLLADEGRAIVELIRKTAGDERGIEVTRTSRFDGQAMQFSTTVTRSDDVPAGTIGYRYEYDTTGD